MAKTDPAAAATKAAKKISAAKHKTMGPSKLIVKTVSASKERKGSLVQTKGTSAFSSFKKKADTKTKPTKKATPKAKKPAAQKPAAAKKPKTAAARKPTTKKSQKAAKKPAVNLQ